VNHFFGYARTLNETIQTTGVTPGPPASAQYPGVAGRVFNAGTEVLASIFADDLGTIPFPNPFSVNSDGQFSFYGPTSTYDLYFSTGVIDRVTREIEAPSYPSGLFPPPGGDTLRGRLARRTDGVRGLWMDSGQQWVSVVGEVIDVKDFGAVGDGAADDTLAIQTAIEAAVAAGGGMVYLPRGVYEISDVLVLNMGAPDVSVALVGAGCNSTQIVQSNNAVDLFQIGANGAQVADSIQIRDLRLTGGRYGLNLNNALMGRFDRLTIESNHTAIYFQGQNESHVFRDIVLSGNGSTQHGIWGANLNGGPGLVLDLPEIQKCSFERFRVHAMADTAVLLTAGVLGNQQSSGANRFKDFTFESNKREALEFHFSYATSVDGATIEEQLDADDTYSALSVTDASTVYCRNLYFADGGSHRHKYLCYVHGASLYIADSSLTNAATAEIRNDGGSTALNIVSTIVDDRNSVSFADATCRALSFISGLRDGGANLIEADITMIATADLPSNAANANNLQIAIENAGAGDKNLILFAGGQRFRIDGGTAF
jgi:hypothetical protein